MKSRFNAAERKRIVEAYTSGRKTVALCAEYKVSRSTLYSWIKQFVGSLKSSERIYYRKYIDLKRHTDKLERQVEVIKLSGCGTNASLQEKLNALEKLYGKYSVRTLPFRLLYNTFHPKLLSCKKTLKYNYSYKFSIFHIDHPRSIRNQLTIMCHHDNCDSLSV